MGIKFIQKIRNGDNVIYKFLGIRVWKIKDEHYAIEARLKREIATMRKILNMYCDIKQCPPIQGEAREHQLKCLDILKQVVEVLDKYNMKYWLDFGTLLGAYRHKGFVPWDDDIDLSAPRSECERLLPILQQHFNTEHLHVRLLPKNIKWRNFQIRIVSRYNDKIGIDIFPVDYYYLSSNATADERDHLRVKIKESRKKLVDAMGKRECNEELISEFRSWILKETKECILENKSICRDAPGMFYGIDYPCITRKSALIDYNTIFPTKKIEFEGGFYNCPNDVKSHLENLYNNFMEFPNVF